MDSATPFYKVPRAIFYMLLTWNQVRTRSALEVSSCPCTAQQSWQLRAKIVCTLRTRPYTRSVSQVKAKQLWSGDYERYHTGDPFFGNHNLPTKPHSKPQRTSRYDTVTVIVRFTVYYLNTAAIFCISCMSITLYLFSASNERCFRDLFFNNAVSQIQFFRFYFLYFRFYFLSMYMWLYS
jgi:hypothetical protein